MAWIRLDRDEMAPALPPLIDPDGETVQLSEQRGKASVVLLLCPHPDGKGCALALRQLSAVIEEIVAEDAFAFAIMPGARPADLPLTPIPALLDRGGSFRAALAALLEFDTSGLPLLYILDDEGRPVQAWVGALGHLAEPGEDLGRAALSRLQRAALRCPE